MSVRRIDQDHTRFRQIVKGRIKRDLKEPGPERLFQVASQRRSELEQRHTPESYAQTLDEIARR